jgi:uracil-DNA glycosylase
VNLGKSTNPVNPPHLVSHVKVVNPVSFAKERIPALLTNLVSPVIYARLVKERKAVKAGIHERHVSLARKVNFVSRWIMIALGKMAMVVVKGRQGGFSVAVAVDRIRGQVKAARAEANSLKMWDTATNICRV